MGNTVGELVAAAREEGRAAGYAEAVQRAADLAWATTIDRDITKRVMEKHGQHGVSGMMLLGDCIAKDIRALTPADKEKP